MVDWNNSVYYKNCSKKFYDVYVCLPPKNTIVINKLEQNDVVQIFGGRTYFTANNIQNLQYSNPQMIKTLQEFVSQGKAYAIVDSTRFVLYGTVGEMWTVDMNALARTYTFIQNGKPLQINQQTLNQRMKNGCLDWTMIRTSKWAVSGNYMACFVPIAQKGQVQTAHGRVLNINSDGVQHGKGDFVVCSKLPDGQPNLMNKWVVNGNVFAATYNNQGWTDCLSNSVTIDRLLKPCSLF